MEDFNNHREMALGLVKEEERRGEGAGFRAVGKKKGFSVVPLLLAAAEAAERIIKFVGADAAGTAAPPTIASLSCWEFLQQGGVRVLD